MTRPLVITDCDEVLMHMVVPFAEWVDAEHGVIFRIEDASFANALKRKECGTPLEAAEVWLLLDGFFRKEMVRQYQIHGALSAMAGIAAEADIVVLRPEEARVWEECVRTVRYGWSLSQLKKRQI